MELKQVGLLIIALIVGGVLYYIWDALRPGDPDKYKLGAGLIGFLLSYAVLYFSTKEG